MKRSFNVLLFLLPIMLPSMALAHVDSHEMAGAGFGSGFLHPISGWDHILAMVAVGLWGAQLGKPAIWVLPVAFPMVMAFGAFLGLIGIALPGVEIGIALSAICLGILVATQTRPALWICAVVIGFFAIFHGHAHGVELPAGANGALFSIGFVISTGLLHACGIAIGLIHRWPIGQRALQAAGACVAIAGGWFLYGAI